MSKIIFEFKTKEEAQTWMGYFSDGGQAAINALRAMANHKQVELDALLNKVEER